MWPFKKKEKKKLIFDEHLLKGLANSLKPKCPRPECICYDCVSRGKCVIENEMRSSSACFVNEPGTPKILSCSLQKARKGELDNGKKKDGSAVLRTTLPEYRIDILEPK